MLLQAVDVSKCVPGLEEAKVCLGAQETPHGNRMSSRQQSRLLALGSNGSCQTIEAGKSQVDRHGDYMYHDKASDSRPVLWFIFCQRMRLLRVTTHALLGLLPYSTNIRALTGWVSSAGISIPPGLCAELLGICSQARITYIPLSQSHLSMILRNGVAHRSCSMPYCRRAPCRTQ